MTTIFDWPPEVSPSPGRYRYHCEMCGRFVPFTTVRTTYSSWDGERRDWGRCKTHGEVEVFWGQP
jgi:hypothetical protein